MRDTELLLGNYLVTREKKRAYNDVNREMAKELPGLLDELKELESKDKLTRKEERKLKYLKMVESAFSLTKKANFTELFYYVDGKREKIYVRKDIFNEWYDNKSSPINKNVEQGISKWTGVRLLKAMATGANPLFALMNFTLNRR